MEVQNDKSAMEQNKTRVEKLKRRIIRAVAVKLRSNPTDEQLEEMWDSMQKNSKCDCKILWKHMRAVTMKKLKRLLPAADRIENITPIARLTLTDWLLFDLVLVHEKIDVIGLEMTEATGEDPAPLVELFFLVNEYRIEKLKGNDLVDAWLHLTREYNSGGRKCSPMLLQRRWYQLKEVARKNFYDFWKAYRGNKSQLPKAQKYKPSALQIDLVREYKTLITQPFVEWEELIKIGKVILPHQFDEKISASRGLKKDSGPELELLEQTLETIDVDDESDTEDTLNQNAEPTNVVKVKPEPKDDDLIEVDDMEDGQQTINIPCETPFGNDTEQIDRLVVDCTKKEDASPVHPDTEDSNSRFNSNGAEISDDSCDVLSKEEGNKSKKAVQGTFDEEKSHEMAGCEDNRESNNSSHSRSHREIETSFYKSPSPVEDIIKVEEDDLISQYDNEDGGTLAEDCFLPRIENVTSIANNENVPKDILVESTQESGQNDNLSKVNNETVLDDKVLLGNFDDLPSDIHFVDDGIVISEDENSHEGLNENIKTEEDPTSNDEETDNKNETPKIDLKLLLFPTVYTKRLDDMDVFKLIPYNHITDGRLIECVAIESKPIDFKAVKLEDISPTDESTSLHENELNEDPCLSDQEDTLLKHSHETCKESTNSIKSSTVGDHEDTNLKFCKDSDSSDEECIPLNVLKSRVSINSWILNKPRVVNYNPILLCKNPDFNTRLKRLTAGFFTYEKNREYLKRCQPITIDLHKSFESKLVGNTLYLNDINVPVKPTLPEPENLSSASYIPSVSQQSEDKEKRDTTAIKNSTANTEICERNKVINLPDITEVRRVNQKLLTAEVAPLHMSCQHTSTTTETSKNLEIVAIEDKNRAEISETFNKHNIVPSIPLENDNLLKENTIIIQDSEETLESTTINNTQRSEDIIIREEQIYTSGVSKNPNSNLNNVQVRSALDCATDNESVARLNKQRTKRPRYNVPWTKKLFYIKHEEALLALDSVDKMLMLFSGETPDHKSMKKIKRLKETEEESSKKTFEQTLGLANPPNIKSPTGTIIPQSGPMMSDIQSTRTKQDLSIEKKQLNRNKTRNRKQYCCWAAKKIACPRLRKLHPCKKAQICNCCCMDKLNKKLNFLTDVQIKPQNSAIVLSDDDEKHMQKSIEDENYLNPSTKDLQELETTSIVVDGVSKKLHVPNFVIRSAESIGHFTNDNSIDHKVFNIKDVPIAPISYNKQSYNNNTDVDRSNMNQIVYAGHQSYIANDSISATPNIKKITINNKTNLPPPLTLVRRSTRSKVGFIGEPSQTSNTNVKTINVKIKKQMQSSSAPVFVGTNKILLSTVRNPSAQRMSVDPPKISLPDGVNFVLLPNNELALSIDPGVELDSEQLVHLESVIQTLQNILSVPEASQNTPIVIDDNDEGKQIPREEENLNKAIRIGEDKDPVSQSSINTDNSDEKSGNNIQKTSDIITDNENIVSIDKEKVIDENSDTTKVSSNVGNKTILSDLMEMSGISEEDVQDKPILETASPNVPITLLQKSVDINTPEMHPDILKLFNTPNALAALARRPDLSIITSYNDLKYAFHHNAKFFKLDIITGEMSQISIFIKKKEQLYKKPTKVLKEYEPIDLTDDNDETTKEDELAISTETISTPPEEIVKNTETTSQAKPLKLFKAMHPSILRSKFSVRGVEMRTKSIRSGSLADRLNGKQVLNIINVSRKKQKLSQVNSILLESEEDSDDEPLAKKAKRKTENAEVAANTSPCDEEIDEEMSKDTPNETETEPAVLGPTTLMEVDDPSINPDCAESDDDCILGV